MIKLVIGLGNIGEKYKHTRHNVGFAVITSVAKKCGVKLIKGRELYGVTVINHDGNQVRLIRPRTYMNRSGIAVRGAAERFGVQNDEILVIYDDIYLPVGSIRIRKKGSAAGHKGIGSIIDYMETAEILRLKVGVGSLPEGADQADFVLSRFSPDESKIIKKALGKSADAVLYSISHSPETAMSRYNINPASDDAKKSEAV